MRRPARGRAGALALICACALVLPAGASAAGPVLTARAAALIEASTGQQLYGLNSGQELAIASTTKIMTALVTLQQVHRLSTVFASPPGYRAAPEDSQIGLRPGQRMSVHDLLLAMLLPSADDAAEDLAYNIGHRSVARFVDLMNAQARRLGLSHTHYATPVGLDTPGNYSSASDLVKLTRYVLADQPFFTYAVSLPAANVHIGARKLTLINRDDLVARMPWIHGVKTGHTSDAGYVLVSSATRDGMTLIAAVLGTSSETARDQNALAVLGYGFENFHLVRPVRLGQVFARPSVADQPHLKPRLIARGAFTRVLPRSERVTLKVKAPRQLNGPLRRGTREGTVLVVAGGHVLARVPLVLDRRVPAVSPLTLAARFITRPFTLVLLAALLGMASFVAVRRREHTRSHAQGGA